MADEGVPFRQIAELIGRRLQVPIVSSTPAQARARFNWLAPFVGYDNPASSRLTQERLGWRPREPGLIADLDRPGYFRSWRLSPESRTRTSLSDPKRMRLGVGIDDARRG